MTDRFPAGKLALGLALGAGAGALARRWWRSRFREGAAGAARLRGGHGDDVGLALAEATGVPMLGENAVQWCFDEAVLERIDAAVRAARRSIHVGVYIWKPGGVGTALAQAIAARAREGIAVRILVDPVGSPGFADVLAPELRDAGCEVRYFRPPRRRPFAITGRNHRKLVVVDGRVGFTGGFGISPEWATGGAAPRAWRESSVQIEGPTVGQMQAAFAAHWLEAGGALLPRLELESARPAGSTPAAYVTSMDVKGHSHARWVTRIALAAARERAWIANAYFVPPPAIVGALCQAAAGADVRLLLPGPWLDHAAIRWMQRRHYGVLRRSGISVFEYQPTMLHAKTMLIDRDLVVVGSINLDFLSMEWLEEGSLVMQDAAVARELEERWNADLEVSVLVARSRSLRPAPHPGARAPWEARAIRAPEARRA